MQMSHLYAWQYIFQEGENEGMRARLRELISSNEELGRRETSARAKIAGHDSSRTHIQRQLDRFNRTMDSLQEWV